MDKADKDDSTPAPDRNAEPDQATPRIPPAVSKAPPPITPIRGRGSYVAPKPPAPPAKYLPPAPTGYTTLPAAPNLLASNAEAWGIPPGRLPAPADLRAYAQVIGEKLAAGSEWAAGIHSYNGKLVRAPAETWRTSGYLNRTKESAVFLALNGESIRFPFPLRWGSFDCYPILSCRTLAQMFGAENPPDAPPPSVMDSIREVQSKDWEATQTEAKAATPVKKLPVACAALLHWWVGYRTIHRDPDKRPNAAAQKAAAKAHFPDHAPPTEIMMQKLRADPRTPAEWREGGRRPKSS